MKLEFTFSLFIEYFLNITKCEMELRRSRTEEVEEVVEVGAWKKTSCYVAVVATARDYRINLYKRSGSRVLESCWSTNARDTLTRSSRRKKIPSETGSGLIAHCTRGKRIASVSEVNKKNE